MANKEKLSTIDRLKDIFTSNIIVRKKNDKLIASKVRTDTNTFVDNFKRAFKSKYSKLHSSWGTHLQQPNKNIFYADYEKMDEDPIISAVLDIFADESVLRSEEGDILKIYSDDEDIKKILESLFNDTLNIEFNLWSWIRNLTKYGDHYLQPILKDGYGIVDFELLSVYDVERRDLEDKTIFSVNGTEYQDYDVVHFRLLSDTNFFPYGRSMVEGGRKVWRQLTLMEEAMLIHRIMRAPEKRIFKIDVGNLPPESINSYMEGIIADMKKEPYQDADGNINLEFNLHNMLEDIFMPVRGGKSGTEIDTLPAPQYDGIEDIEYLKSKLLASLKVPQQFLNFTENNEGKATLSAMDLRFARTIERIQTVVLSELYNLAYMHLTLQGFDKQDLMKFDLELNNPSIIYQQEKLEFLAQKITVASDMKDLNMFSTDKIYEDIFRMSGDEIEDEKGKLKGDKKFESVLTQIEEGEYEEEGDNKPANDSLDDDSDFSFGSDEEDEDEESKDEKEPKDDKEPKTKEEVVDKHPLKHDFRNSALGIK